MKLKEQIVNVQSQKNYVNDIVRENELIYK